MAFLVRLPKHLDDWARDYAPKAGISLNALVALALRDYLRAQRDADRPRPVVQPAVVPTPAGPSVPGSPVIRERYDPKELTRQQRRALERLSKKGKR